MTQHLYDNQIEILEAMEVETSWGSRDWIDGFHRDDLHALSLALLHAQSSPVVWESKVAGDPFRQDFMRLCKDLLIKPPANTRGSAKEVHPSYLTYRPGVDYLTEKVLHFFTTHLEDRARLPSLHTRQNERKRYFWMKDHTSKLVKLCDISLMNEYENGTRLKAELLYHLYKVCDARNDYAGKRQLYYEAMKYVDALFGSEPLH